MDITLKAKEKYTKPKRMFFKDSESFKKNICGGYKIYILNYAKHNEFKFNITRTDGRILCTNDKEEFLTFLKERL